LTTEWEQTKLTIDLTAKLGEEEDHNFGIAGFKNSNIFFITNEKKVELQQMSEFHNVFHSLRKAVLTRSKQMSLGLGLCVFVLTLGVGAMMFATIRRHQLLIESVVYSSIGSLRRIKDKTYVHQKEKKLAKQSEPEKQISKRKEEQSSNEITTTTKVDFFPRYSLVNKSQRGVPRHLKEKKAVETQSTKPSEDLTSEKAPSHKPKYQASSINEIFSTLKFSNKRKSQNIPVKDTKPEIQKPVSSFYYQHSSSGSSSKYDLTLGKNTTEVAAQVHQASYGADSKDIQQELDPGQAPSPEPLIQPEKIYSFRALQEKCRQMIAGSKPFPDSTKL